MYRPLYFILLACLLLSGKIFNTTEFDECCGKCVGSAYCSACKNCSRCQHCSAGGTCGVCASPTPRESSKIVPSSKGAVQSKVANKITQAPSPSASKDVTGIVVVDTLNVRSGPGSEYPIIKKIPKSTAVWVLSNADANWYQIIFIDEKNIVEGFVFKRYLRIN